MILPNMHGSLQQQGFFIYAAADREYFDMYGRALINSVIHNTSHGVHMHLYDPTPTQLEFCKQPRVSVSWEHIGTDQFQSALELWTRADLSEIYQARRDKMLGIKVVDHALSINTNLEIWLRKTYYACMRFVRLAELVIQPQRFLEIDVDGIVRKPFQTEFGDDDQVDLYLYEKHKTDRHTGQQIKTGHLAGSILYTPKPRALEFIHKCGAAMRQEIEIDNIYWFLDQNILDATIQNYRKGLLPIGYVDWHMHPDSAIWTAKGKRKDLAAFVQELRKYQ